LITGLECRQHSDKKLKLKSFLKKKLFIEIILQLTESEQNKTAATGESKSKAC